MYVKEVFEALAYSNFAICHSVQASCHSIILSVFKFFVCPNFFSSKWCSFVLFLFLKGEWGESSEKERNAVNGVVEDYVSSGLLGPCWLGISTTLVSSPRTINSLVDVGTLW